MCEFSSGASTYVPKAMSQRIATLLCQTDISWFNMEDLYEPWWTTFSHFQSSYKSVFKKTLSNFEIPCFWLLGKFSTCQITLHYLKSKLGYYRNYWYNSKLCYFSFLQSRALSVKTAKISKKQTITNFILPKDKTNQKVDKSVTCIET